MPTLTGQITEHFRWEEFFRSGTADDLGLRNRFGVEDIDRVINAHVLFGAVVEPLRSRIGTAFDVTSGYRSPALNAALAGASSKSRHMSAEALDFKVRGIPSQEVAGIAAQMMRAGLPIDQFIWYDESRGGHCHIGIRRGHRPRNQLKHAPSGGGYRQWVP